MDYYKLKGTFDVPIYEELDHIVQYGKYITYYNIKVEEKEKYFKVIPTRYRHDFKMNIMKISGAILPHTDSGITTTINFYFKTGRYLTQFYKCKPSPVTYKVENQTNGNLFRVSDLIPTESFIATPGDAWVLDVTKPHSVQPINTQEHRLAITLCTKDYTYNQVLDMLTETGYIDKNLDLSYPGQ